MSRYADVTTVWDGAVDSFDTVRSDGGLATLVRQVERDVKRSDTAPHVQVFVQWHEHPITLEECSCSQYETDHHPYVEWGAA